MLMFRALSRMLPGLNRSSPASYHLFSGSGADRVDMQPIAFGVAGENRFRSRWLCACHSQTTSPSRVHFVQVGTQLCFAAAAVSQVPHHGAISTSSHLSLETLRESARGR